MPIPLCSNGLFPLVTPRMQLSNEHISTAHSLVASTFLCGIDGTALRVKHPALCFPLRSGSYSFRKQTPLRQGLTCARRNTVYYYRVCVPLILAPERRPRLIFVCNAQPPIICLPFRQIVSHRTSALFSAHTSLRYSCRLENSSDRLMLRQRRS